MKKIPTALIRNPENRAKVLPEITPGCEWVFRGEGVPTRKWDGTCVMKDEDGNWWARREVKPGKSEPEGFAFEHFDEVTGKTQGWEPMEQSPFKKFHEEALSNMAPFQYEESGTYELLGPKIQNNPDKFETHWLVKHSNAGVIDELNYQLSVNIVMILLEDLTRDGKIEGVVWHHPDGRMAKLKGRDL